MLAEFARSQADGTFMYELFGHARDPEERLKLFDSDNARHRHQPQQLDAYKAELISDYHRRARPPELTEKEVETLRSLGYIQ